MVTDYLISKIDKQIDKSRTNSVLFDKTDIQALLDEVKRNRLKDRMANMKKRPQ
jgi:hypothetical protein